MKVDTANLAKTLEFCEGHCETDAEARFLYWIADHLAEGIFADHPQFDRAGFVAQSVPRYIAGTLQTTILAQD